MRAFPILGLALTITLAAAGEAQGQRGGFVPRPPPVRPHVGPHGIPHGGAHGDFFDVEWGWMCAGVVGIGLIVILVGAIKSARESASAGRIRIIAPPPGEAPEYVRRAWVGLELALAPGEAQPRPLATFGVLSGRGEETTFGYAVPGPTAVALLTHHDREAAQWWRENAPHVLDARFLFVFAAECCEKVD